MMTTFVSDIYDWAQGVWPIEGAEPWDAPGLIVGALDHKVSRVLFTVDVTAEVLDEAVDGGFDLIVAHHPYLMRGVSSIAENTVKGSLVSKAVRSGVAIYSAHTNADIVANGVSDTLAQKIGLTERTALSPVGDLVGHGRVGQLSEEIPLGEFARMLARLVPSTAEGVKVSGDFDQSVRRVALCAGAGDSFITDALRADVDVYITSDLRHHVAQDARESALLAGGRPALINISHWAAEWLWLEVASAQLAADFPDLQCVVSHINTDPWDFVVTQ